MASLHNDCRLYVGADPQGCAYVSARYNHYRDQPG